MLEGIAGGDRCIENRIATAIILSTALFTGERMIVHSAAPIFIVVNLTA